MLAAQTTAAGYTMRYHRSPIMPDVLTTEQAAQYLQVSVETIKRHARRGWLPGAKVGKAWRFRKVDLDDW